MHPRHGAVEVVMLILGGMWLVHATAPPVKAVKEPEPLVNLPYLE